MANKKRRTFPELEERAERRRRQTATLAERQGAALGRDAREQLQPLTEPQTEHVFPDFSSAYDRMFSAMVRPSAIGSMFSNSYVTFAGRDATIKPPAVDCAKLAALKEAEPYRVQQCVPDMVHVITAWRAWDINFKTGSPRLEALGRTHLWEPRTIMSAFCDPSDGMFGVTRSRSQHAAPAMDCDCGIWAFKELDGLVAALGNKYSAVRVLGNVQLWGRVIETENGYRAQYAYPSELWLLDSSLEELGLIYDVPVRMIRA